LQTLIVDATDAHTPLAHVDARSQTAVALPAVHACPSASTLGHVWLAVLHAPVAHPAAPHASPGPAGVALTHVAVPPSDEGSQTKPEPQGQASPAPPPVTHVADAPHT
jgi:hypothetical protein